MATLAPKTAGPGTADFRITTAPGIDLFVRYRRPANPKGTVLVVHGVGEHAGRWANLEHALVEGGWSYYGYDHRGHGQSTGRRVHIDRFSNYLDDLQRVYDEVRAHAGEGKVFVYGHSMGAMVVALWAALRRPTVWGVILAAAPFRLAVKVPKVKIAAAKILSKIVPTLVLANEVDPAILSHDPAVGKAYRLDPLVETKATVRWGDEFLKAQVEIKTRGAEIEVPVLLLHGTGDALADYRGTEDFVTAAISSDKTVKIYDGLFHELHNEPAADRNRVFGDVLAWLEARR